MMDDGITKGTCTYVGTTDNNLKELLHFQGVLYKKFYNYEHYKDMQPDRNQPARLCGTSKTHKF